MRWVRHPGTGGSLCKFEINVSAYLGIIGADLHNMITSKLGKPQISRPKIPILGNPKIKNPQN